MKKTLCIFMMMIFLCGCATTNSSNSVNSINFASSANEPIDMSFDSFSGESGDEVVDFIKDPRDNQLYPDIYTIFRFEEHNGQLLLTGISTGDGPILALNDPDNWKWGEYKTSEYFQRAIIFLCDENAIKQCFRENGIENIQKIVIFDGPDEVTGYVITAITETQVYFMTVPLSNEKYGDYIFQKVYTQDEFLKIFSPRPAKVFINEKEITFSTTPILGDGLLEMDLFELLDALGAQYTFDKDHKTISANNVTLRMDGNDGSYAACIYKDGKLVIDLGSVRYVKGKYIGDMIVCERLCGALGYDMEERYDDYSVRIVKN